MHSAATTTLITFVIISSSLSPSAQALDCFNCSYFRQGDIEMGEPKCLSDPASLTPITCDDEVASPACLKTYREDSDSGFESVARSCAYVEQAPNNQMKCHTQDQGDGSGGKGTFCYCKKNRCNQSSLLNKPTQYILLVISITIIHINTIIL